MLTRSRDQIGSRLYFGAELCHTGTRSHRLQAPSPQASVPVPCLTPEDLQPQAHSLCNPPQVCFLI